jgi:hypothetical protein
MDIRPGHNGAQAPSEPSPIGVERRLERDTRELLAAIERLSDDATKSLRDQLDRHPYPSLGLGLLGGYVLGAGLSSRLGTVVLAAAWRAGLASLISRRTSSGSSAQ